MNTEEKIKQAGYLTRPDTARKTTSYRELFIYYTYKMWHGSPLEPPRTPEETEKLLNEAVNRYYDDPKLHRAVKYLLSLGWQDKRTWDAYYVKRRTGPNTETISAEAWKQAAKKWRREALDCREKLEAYMERGHD